MNFQIQVLSTEKQYKPTDKGAYTQLELTFKNLASGKVESKKIMSFASPAYHSLADAQQDNIFNIESKKNDKGYWDWIKASPGVMENKPTTASATTAAPRSNYETPEERAARQVYIVKQSSISNAVAVLSVGAKTPPTKEAVTELAQYFTDFVFSKDKIDWNSFADDPTKVLT